MGTRPRMPRTILITSWWPPRRSMQSINTTVPSGTENSVSKTRVPSRYRRVTFGWVALGAMLQWPLSGDPNSAAKQAVESNRGKQSQSMDPLRPTRAAVALLPMSDTSLLLWWLEKDYKRVDWEHLDCPQWQILRR